MYPQFRNTTQIVKVETVNISSNEVHCTSKDGGRFTLKIPVSNGFYRIPRSGESWIVRREDLTNWYFEGVVPDETAYGSALPQEGDVVVEAPSNFKISADNIFMNNIPFGVLDYDEFDTEEELYEVTLEEAAISDVVQVFNNGLLIPPSGMVIREQTLLFEEPLNAGKVVIYYMRSPTR